MAMHSKFLKTLRRFLPALAATVLLTAVAVADSGDKVHWVRSTDGVRIAYEVRGKGSLALVFVHGWSCNRGFWAGQMEPFSKQFKVVAVDLAGHGDSGRNREKWTIQSYGEDVAAVVKKLDVKRVILIGHSMGGDVIPEAALRLPGRVVGLIWLDTYKKLGCRPDPRRSPRICGEISLKFLRNHSRLRSKYVRKHIGPGPRGTSCAHYVLRPSGYRFAISRVSVQLQPRDAADLGSTASAGDRDQS